VVTFPALTDFRTFGALLSIEGRRIIKPNIVFVISDDHNANVMGCSGDPWITTRNMDRLAREGRRFTNAFAVTGTCAPSRASFLTGKYPHQCAVPILTVGRQNTFLLNEVPFPARLQAAGYHSAHIGKWHLGDGEKPKPGYDYWAGFRWLGEFFNTRVTINGEQKQFAGYADDILADLAVDYIRRKDYGDQPFCLYVGFKAPHHPFAYPDRMAHELEGVVIREPDNIDEDYAASGKPLEMMHNLIRIREFYDGIKSFDNSWDKYIKSYYRAVMAMDEGLGRIIDAVDEAGLGDNTLFIYTTDQGYSLGTHGLTEKHFAYEEVMRIPMLIRYPGVVAPGTTCDEAVLAIDMAPTFFELGGAESPPDIAGKSIVPLLDGSFDASKPFREDFMFDYYSEHGPGVIPGQFAVRTTGKDKFKLIEYPWMKYRSELYDLDRDPGENCNVDRDPAYQGTLADMQARIRRLRDETDWLKREDYAITSLFTLGPLGGEELSRLRDELVQGRIDVREEHLLGTRTCRWQHTRAHPDGRVAIDWSRAGEAEYLFILLEVELLVAKDPGFLLCFEPEAGHVKAYHQGECYWDSTFSNFHDVRYNPPLIPGSNEVLLEVDAFRREGLKMKWIAPETTIRLAS